MMLCALDESFRTYAVFIEELLFQRTRIYSDADGRAVRLSAGGKLPDLIIRTDVAGIYPDLGNACFDGSDCEPVVEMDIRNERNMYCRDYFFERFHAFFIIDR